MRAAFNEGVVLQDALNGFPEWCVCLWAEGNERISRSVHAKASSLASGGKRAND